MERKTGACEKMELTKEKRERERERERETQSSKNVKSFEGKIIKLKLQSF